MSKLKAINNKPMATNYQTAAGGSNLLGALLSPVDNFAARSAARSEGMQLATYRAQLQEQDLLKEQQAAAEADQFAQTIRKIPFVGRDQQKLQAFVKSEEQQLYKTLRDEYGGNFRKFWAARGPSFLSGAATRLRESPFYAQALQNIQNVALGQESHAKGENLVGQVGPNGYQTGEQQLQDFLAGKSDTYVHNGSYKPDDDFKEVRSTYANGHMPWERVAMSENDKLNYLIDTHGEATGRDKFLRQHQGTSVYYRTDPITKMFDFQNDQARMKMDIGRYGMAQNADRRAATQLGLSINADKRASVNSAMQGELLGLRIQEKKNEINGTLNGKPFDYDLLSHPSEVIRLAHDPANPKKLANGIDLSKLNSLAGVTLFGQNDEVLAQQLGLQKTKYGYTRGNIKSGFTTGNGVHALDLSQSGFTVQSISPTVFYNPSDVRPNGLNPNGVNGYAQVTVQFDNDQAATKAGLYNERWGWLPDESTKAGTGVYTPNSDKNMSTSRTATIFVPVGNIDGNKNKSFVKAIQKNTMGTSAANKAQSDADYPYLDVTF